MSNLSVLSSTPLKQKRDLPRELAEDSHAVVFLQSNAVREQGRRTNVPIFAVADGLVLVCRGPGSG